MFRPEPLAALSFRGVPANDAFRLAEPWQQLAGAAQGHGAGVDHRFVGPGQSRAGGRQKYVQYA
ncbi:hypothetical protein D3C80_1845870 [compost metagenome]